MTTDAPPAHPGQSLGLPATGAGSLASWRARIAAIIVDWAASMAVAFLLFGMGALRGQDWRLWTPMAVYFVEASVLTAVMGGSFGQLLARIGIVRLDGTAIRWWQAVVRTALKCLVIPMLLIGAERRGLNDLMLGTVVVNRR